MLCFLEKKAHGRSLYQWAMEQPSGFIPSSVPFTRLSEMMAGRHGDDGEDDDYMGDLSLFLPPDLDVDPNKKLREKVKNNPPAPNPKSKLPKGRSWQEQRRLERERKQREEDERTRASLEEAIPDSNVGFRMLKMMGYKPGSALGKDGGGMAEPVGLQIRRSRAGIGVEEDAARKERAEVEGKRRREEDMMAEFGTRQKTQWRSRRVVWDYRKGEAALAQLEKREVVEPPKDNENEEKPEEEEEEEVITEEHLYDILTKLRDEHHYCLYCGCQHPFRYCLDLLPARILIPKAKQMHSARPFTDASAGATEPVVRNRLTDGFQNI
ncbi:hypothetical protein ZIOFF_008735 [Zingiber officinale]|uniref:G-patch domain-containing protein n=1 Tax=Zingiber officinale TaxID=94328 RepID=A0A8J5I722_ZINOF|nr:hypothetical protein ZIOFF_008735 [Zingiber officinale]